MVALIKNAMNVNDPSIDPSRFELQLQEFIAFVEEESGTDFQSFATNSYTSKQEGYKKEIYQEARNILAFQAWKRSDVGNGKIAEAVRKAIEIPQNNLLNWQGRYGLESRLHQRLYEAKSNKKKLLQIEGVFFNLYRDTNDEESFSELVNIFGKKYPLVSYLFFLKDRSKYLPIAPEYFDRAFEYLGIEFKTSHKCSWENYKTYISLMANLKAMLEGRFSEKVSLLDAHSFAWMLASQMQQENKRDDFKEYLKLTDSEREAVVKARIGQGRFREQLVTYWSCCAVTNCTELALLRASHIKPWAKSEMSERINPYNGLLLSPTLDASFDAGYISFDDRGRILISARLAASDAKALAIHSEMRLKKIEPEHRRFLAYHRKNIFKNGL